MSYVEALVRLHNSPKVTLTIAKPNDEKKYSDPEKIEVSFEIQKSRSVVYRNIPIEETNTELVYIKIPEFIGEDLKKDFLSAWSKAAQERGSLKVDGTILDLRINPGGEDRKVAEILETILPPDSPIAYFSDRSGETIAVKTEKDDRLDMGKIVVLGRFIKC